MQVGVHYAITSEQAAFFLAARGNDDLLSQLVDHLEESGKALDRCDIDKAWDPISCAIAPSGFDRDPADWPWTGVIVGAQDLHASVDSYINLGYTPPAQVVEVAIALKEILEEGSFIEAYAIMPQVLRNPEYGKEECEYAQRHLATLTAFFIDAAARGAHVLFCVEG